MIMVIIYVVIYIKGVPVLLIVAYIVYVCYSLQFRIVMLLLFMFPSPSIRNMCLISIIGYIFS